eukprot:430601_1
MAATKTELTAASSHFVVHISSDEDFALRSSDLSKGYRDDNVSRESILIKTKGDLDFNYEKTTQTAIQFRKGIFIKEVIYGLLQYFAIPFILFFDGGRVAAENHVLLPVVRHLHPVLIDSTSNNVRMHYPIINQN